MVYRSRSLVLWFSALAAIGAATGIAVAWGPEAPPAAASIESDEPQFPPDVVRVSVPEARRQAALLHSAMHTALQLVHHRYYKEDEGLPIPAAVVREMFADVESEQPVRLRWLVVEGQAMNTDHLARDEFERSAVAALHADQPAHEQVEGGLYRRAAPITLSNACLKCHVPDRKSTENRTAGLIVTIPVLEQ